MYVSYSTKKKTWKIGYTKHKEHNHAMAVDPFQYDQHKAKRPGHREALNRGRAFLGEVPYSKAMRILKKEDLELDRSTFYNLNRKDKGGDSLTRVEQLNLLIGCLVEEDFRVRVLYSYEYNERGEVTSQVVRALFFCSSEQIDLARRFVSEYMYEMDATFNTNNLQLPLEVLVGIDNTNHTFPIAFVYQVTEAADIFAFTNDCLTEYIFYDIQGSKVQLGDFHAGLFKSAGDFNEAEIETAEREGREPQLCTLQYVTVLYMAC